MFGVQVKVNGDWSWLHPTEGKPYRFTTEDAAYSCMIMCYPDQVRSHRLGGDSTVRVHPFPEGE